MGRRVAGVCCTMTSAHHQFGDWGVHRKPPGSDPRRLHLVLVCTLYHIAGTFVLVSVNLRHCWPALPTIPQLPIIKALHWYVHNPFHRFLENKYVFKYHWLFKDKHSPSCAGFAEPSSRKPGPSSGCSDSIALPRRYGRLPPDGRSARSAELRVGIIDRVRTSC